MGEAGDKSAPVIDIKTRQLLATAAPDAAGLDAAAQHKELVAQHRATINRFAAEGLVIPIQGITGAYDIVDADDPAKDGRGNMTRGCIFPIPSTGGFLLLEKSEDHPVSVIQPETEEATQRIRSLISRPRINLIGHSITEELGISKDGFRRLHDGDEGFEQGIEEAFVQLEERRKELATQDQAMHRVQEHALNKIEEIT